MKILAISDVEIGFIYSPMIRDRFQDIDLVISCGDLPYYYLEYILSSLDVPLFYVRGNHSSKIEISLTGSRSAPQGAVDLHQRCFTSESGLLLAGLEGSLRYNEGPFQYSQAEYWAKVFRMVPRFFLNRLRTGRYLDIFVSHAPPWRIHDAEDLPHVGIKAFSWLIKVFQPVYFLHGHIHIYRADTPKKTVKGRTTILNAYGFKEFSIYDPSPGTHANGRLK
jgi:Icc-related predicted phosphoesterase